MAPTPAPRNGSTPPRDQSRRPLHDLRISVTDRCNLRCTYCMPEDHFGESYSFLARGEILSFEEIARVARAAVSLGVRKLRITGGEPLLRRDLPRLVALLAHTQGIDDIALTTNGLLLPKFAAALRDAGLRRLTVSLDSLCDETLTRVSGRKLSFGAILDGLEAARRAGFGSIKINAVIQRGVNDHEVLAMAEFFRGTGITLRFIEYMDVGTLNGWKGDAVVTAAEMRDTIAAQFPLAPVASAYRGEVASRYRYKDGRGEIGFIASVSQPFCGDCTRLRLAPDGDLFTCLFATTGYPLKPVLRGGASDDELIEFLHGVWNARSDRYSESRTSAPSPAGKVEMYHIGG